MGMMIEVRDMYDENEADKWDSIDYYTSTLADVPLLSSPSGTLNSNANGYNRNTNPNTNSSMFTRKTFVSLFGHNSSLTVKARVFFSFLFVIKC